MMRRKKSLYALRNADGETRRDVLRQVAFLIGVVGLIGSLGLAGQASATWEDEPEDATVCRFSGPARVNLASAPPGTPVEAWVEGEKVAETVAVVQGERSVYTFRLDGRFAGKAVIFRYPGYPQLGEPGRATCEIGRKQLVTLEAEVRGGCGGG